MHNSPFLQAIGNKQCLYHNKKKLFLQPLQRKSYKKYSSAGSPGAVAGSGIKFTLFRNLTVPNQKGGSAVKDEEKTPDIAWEVQHPGVPVVNGTVPGSRGESHRRT